MEQLRGAANGEGLLGTGPGPVGPDSRTWLPRTVEETVEVSVFSRSEVHAILCKHSKLTEYES